MNSPGLWSRWLSPLALALLVGVLLRFYGVAWSWLAGPLVALLIAVVERYDPRPRPTSRPVRRYVG